MTLGDLLMTQFRKTWAQFRKNKNILVVKYIQHMLHRIRKH